MGERALDPEDERVTIWDSQTGRKITGNAAPMAKNLEKYLKKRPHCEVWEGKAHQVVRTQPIDNERAPKRPRSPSPSRPKASSPPSAAPAAPSAVIPGQVQISQAVASMASLASGDRLAAQEAALSKTPTTAPVKVEAMGATPQPQAVSAANMMGAAVAALAAQRQQVPSPAQVSNEEDASDGELSIEDDDDEV